MLEKPITIGVSMQSTVKTQPKDPISKPLSWRTVYRLEWVAVVIMVIVVSGILVQAMLA